MAVLPMFVALLLVVSPEARAYQVATNAFAKAIELVKSLSAKVTEDMETEAKAFKQYFEWSDEFAWNTNCGQKFPWNTNCGQNTSPKYSPPIRRRYPVNWRGVFAAPSF